MKVRIVRVIGFRRSSARAGGIGCALVAGMAALTPVAPAAAVPLAALQSVVTGHVSPIPARGTPQLAPAGGTEQVRQIAECGGTMYAVGSFTAIEWGGVTYSRHNVFSFSATSPYRITSWNPDANGAVNSIALTPDCSRAWLGGSFTTVASTPVGNIAKVSTSTGSVVKNWAHSASRPVDTVLYTPNGHVLVGGKFTSINGSGRSFYASLNPSTGRDDGYLNLTLSGTYVYPGAGPNYTQAYNQQLSPDGRHVLVEGVFTSVQGQSRNQAGPGAIPAPGMGAFTPGGSLLTNANGTAGRYSRARGFGADDILRTSAGLWIASDNFDGSVTCGDVTGHAGICFLPNS